jgi:hypothetical protein
MGVTASASFLRSPVNSSSWESVLEEGVRLEKAFVDTVNVDKRQMIYRQWFTIKQWLYTMAGDNTEKLAFVGLLDETFQRYNKTSIYPIFEQPFLD